MALGTAVCWTVSAISFEGASRRVGSLPVNLIRLVVAVLLLSAYGWLARGLAFPTDASWHAWAWLSLSGVVGFFVGDMALFRAFVVIGARLATLLMTLAPPIAALTEALILREPPRPWNVLGMVVTLSGIVWVVSERVKDEGEAVRHVPRWGLALGVGGAAGQGIGAVLSKIGMDQPGGQYDPFAATQVRALAGIVGFTILLTVMGAMPKVFRALRHPSAMGYLTSGAIFGPFLGVSLLLASLQRIDSGVANTLVAMVPVVMLPVAVLWRKERVTGRAALGACVAVGGVAILVLT